ncbi:MAG: hypothetical protein HQ567_16710 [Candidatus Nealsonbacteria bacterium]|nr:hypothetical protein [Candidatus Nealsonbacteria bacterium]
MHAFQLLLTGFVLLQPAAVPPGTAPADSDAVGPSEQVRQMLTRLDRANRIVLDDNEVAVERAKAIIRLRQIAQGNRPSQAELDRLRQTTAQREQAAVERLARQFRIEVYRTFRQRRSTVAGRRADLARVLASWESAGGQYDEQEWLIDWLELAIHNSTPGSVGPMPKAPIFTLPEFEPLVAGDPPARIERPVTPHPSLSSAAMVQHDRRTTVMQHAPQPGTVAVDPSPPRAVAMTTLPARVNVSDTPLHSVPAAGGTVSRPGRSISPPARHSAVAAAAIQSPRPEHGLPVILPPSTSRRPQITFPARLAQHGAPATAKQPTIEQPAATAPVPDRPGSATTAGVAALRRPTNGEPAIVAHLPARPPARRPDTDVLPATAPGDSAEAPVPSVASRRSNVPLPSESAGRGPTGTLAPRPNRAVAIPEPPAVPAEPLATVTPRRADPDWPSGFGVETPPLPSRTAEASPRLLPPMEDPFAGPAAPRSTPTPPLPDSLAMIPRRDGPATFSPVQRPSTVSSAGPPAPSNLPPAPPRRPRAATGFLDSPPPTPADLPQRVASLPSAAAALPDVRPTAPRTSVSAARVNLDELKVRIAGTNLALRALEDDVDEDLRWTAARLEPLVERLGGLIERRGDLSLFLDLLGPGDRSRVGRLDSTRLAVSQLAERIVDARAMVTVDLFPGSDADRRHELARLDQLSRTLAEMVVER